MKIEIQQEPPLQEGRPGAVYLLLIGSDGRTKGVVSVCAVMKPVFRAAEEEFRVGVTSGDTTLSHPIDIKVSIS